MSWKRLAARVSQPFNPQPSDQFCRAIRAISFLFALVLGLWLLMGVSRAQSFTATIRGTIRDESGAVVPGANITIQNMNKGWTRTTTTDSQGDYVITQLPADTYAITVQLTGFKTEVREGIVLQVGQEARIDFTLTVGQLEERVVVTAGAPLVQSENAMVGNV
ncbi:MAG TPA: carboxypeptidase-like regulatory domain-containing protein, partial [Blastocatellia bacterium]|nr:carboxypeptidase-like regulatory domain-containing protein [Blastocatellia bacterium]